VNPIIVMARLRTSTLLGEARGVDRSQSWWCRANEIVPAIIRTMMTRLERRRVVVADGLRGRGEPAGVEGGEEEVDGVPDDRATRGSRRPTAPPAVRPCPRSGRLPATWKMNLDVRTTLGRIRSSRPSAT
jgi:hypothetical protein